MDYIDLITNNIDNYEYKISRIFINIKKFFEVLDHFDNTMVVNVLCIRNICYPVRHKTDYITHVNELNNILTTYKNMKRVTRIRIMLPIHLLFLFDLISYLIKKNFNQREFILSYNNNKFKTIIRINKSWTFLYNPNKIIIIHKIGCNLNTTQFKIDLYSLLITINIQSYNILNNPTRDIIFYGKYLNIVINKYNNTAFILNNDIFNKHKYKLPPTIYPNNNDPILLENIKMEIIKYTQYNKNTEILII